MAAFVYNLGLSLVRAAYRVAEVFNPKARAFREGRVRQVSRLRKTFPISDDQPLIWFHCASLGEFEQGRPVIEAIKTWRTETKILLTFFSPSGYEVKKNYPHADYVFYLPWDTRKNALWFAENIRPALAVFVKYEFWHHYSRALREKNIPLISISAIFRPKQIYFKPYGSFFRTILRNFHFFFVQNQESVDLLKSIGITSVGRVGDTRFDRVNQIAEKAIDDPLALQFKRGKKLMVVGSAWPDDMRVLIPFINKNMGAMKFIIAPHEIQEGFLGTIEHDVAGKTIRYSAMNDGAEADVLLVDQIGLLAQLYKYGEVAFVGGGFKEGLHNILEAACYGIPIFFGDRAYHKYQEAVDLIAQGGAFSVQDFLQLDEKYRKLIDSPTAYQQACSTTRQYVKSNLGATDIIKGYCQKIIEEWKGA